MGNAQFIAMFCVDALAEFQHSGDDQLVFVGEKQREGFSAGDLGDREGKQRFDNDGGELCAISHGSIHNRSPCPDPIGRSIRCHTRRPSRSSRETASGSVHKPPASNPALSLSYGADLFAAEFVQQQRLKARFNVDSLAELPIGSAAPRVDIVRRA